MLANRKRHLILSLLYHFRCLTFEQIYKYVYKEDGLAEKTCLNTLSLLIKDGMIEKVGYYSEYSYYIICSKGIRFLRKWGIFSVNKHRWNRVEFTELLSAKEIKICDEVSRHQLALNEFVINFMNNYSNEDTEYYDEKYCSHIIDNIRPDGLIKHNNTLYFLEEDMNTERKARLLKKWNSYRTFIYSNSFLENMTYDIKVLFILNNVSSSSTRKYRLKEYIDTNLRNEISKSFNIYVGTPLELFASLDNIYNYPEYLPSLFNDKGFNIAKGVFTNENLCNTCFDNYIYKIDSNGSLLTESGITMDFVIDDFRNDNMYSYKKLIQYPKYNSEFIREKGYDLKYILVVNSVKDAIKLLKATNVYSENVYFTTVERLNDYTFNSALFRIERNNILYHFKDGNLRVKLGEEQINLAV